ncbi:MAG: hypothetical protein U9O53_00170 [archaeon]|nr:hypothetical protein [archaeon]
MGHNLIEVLEAIHTDYNRREGRDDYFLDNKSITDLLGHDLGSRVSTYFKRKNLKNPADFVVNMWLEWIYRTYPINSRIDPAKNDDYFEKVKYPVLEKIVVPKWGKLSKNTVLQMLDRQDNFFSVLPEELDCEMDRNSDRLMFLAENKFLEFQENYQNYIGVYALKFTFYSYGVEDVASVIFDCFYKDIDIEDGFKMLCSTVRLGFAKNGFSDQDFLFYAYGAMHSFDIISKHQVYRQDKFQRTGLLEKIRKIFS